MDHNEGHHTQSHEPKECQPKENVPPLTRIVNHYGTDLVIDLLGVDLLQQSVNFLITEAKSLREEGVGGTQLEEC